MDQSGKCKVCFQPVSEQIDGDGPGLRRITGGWHKSQERPRRACAMQRYKWKSARQKIGSLKEHEEPEA